jgi:hypothetical protein
LVWIAGAAVIIVLALGKMIPWSTADRQVIAGSPSLGGLYSISAPKLRKGARACVSYVPLTTEVRSVSIVARTATQPVPLTLELSAPGYKTTALAPANWPSGGPTPVTVALPKSPPRDVVGKLCITNAGTHSIDLVGTDEPRSQVAAQSTIDGKPVSDLAVTLYGGQESVLSRTGTIVGHAADLTSTVPSFIAWIFVLALVIGVPLAALLALSISFGAEADDEPPA